MQYLSSRNLTEICSSPQARNLVELLLACYCAALDQCVAVWTGIHPDATARQRKQFVKGELQRLVEAGCLRCYTVPILWPPIIGDHPRFHYRRGEPRPDFCEIASLLSGGYPTNSAPRALKVFTVGDRIDELATHLEIPNPYDPPFLLRVHGEDRTIWGNLGYIARHCAACEASSSETAVTDGTRDIPAFLKCSLLSRLLNLTELYVRLRSDGLADTNEWDTTINFGRAELSPYPNPISHYFPDRSIRGSLIHSYYDSEGRLILTDPIKDPYWLKNLPFYSSRTAAVLARSIEPHVLEEFHDTVMKEVTFVQSGVAFRYLNDAYQLW